MFYESDIQLAIDTFNYGETPSLAKGIEAEFYHVCRNVGFKLYRSRWSRDKNHALLTAGNDVSDVFCVKAGPMFKCKDKYNNTRYGFLVEALDTTLFDYAANKFGYTLNQYGYKILVEEGYNYCDDIANSLQNLADELAFDFNDNHAKNIAGNLDENGEPIQWLIIDLGEGEISD
jgi:hypothetical protein